MASKPDKEEDRPDVLSKDGRRNRNIKHLPSIRISEDISAKIREFFLMTLQFRDGGVWGYHYFEDCDTMVFWYLGHGMWRILFHERYQEQIMIDRYDFNGMHKSMNVSACLIADDSYHRDQVSIDGPIVLKIVGVENSKWVNGAIVRDEKMYPYVQDVAQKIITVLHCVTEFSAHYFKSSRDQAKPLDLTNPQLFDVDYWFYKYYRSTDRYSSYNETNYMIDLSTGWMDARPL